MMNELAIVIFTLPWIIGVYTIFKLLIKGLVNFMANAKNEEE